MELTYIIIAAAILVLTALLWAGSPDTTRVLGAEPFHKPARAARAVNSVLPRARRLLAVGRKIDAVKLVRDRTGLPLEAAQHAVKVLMQSPRAQPRPTGARGSRRPAHGTAERVKQLVKGGRNIEAIKLLQEQTGMGLKQAKELVERLG